VQAQHGETAAYIWGDRMISLHHCPTCKEKPGRIESGRASLSRKGEVRL